ncbi:hypothetical protein BDV96DRAFT_587185 [Lophiotrema nucula]|uniref:Uncharacterized protein n=1 Tax=Lophiotrema nucula TaxID=690887 RepID=A0A6A5YPV0_9PLEO|nr:hypothetical protein BDV96DRAFT_587185 [Lophiotrema nucula]
MARTDFMLAPLATRLAANLTVGDCDTDSCCWHPARLARQQDQPAYAPRPPNFGFSLL